VAVVVDDAVAIASVIVVVVVVSTSAVTAGGDGGAVKDGEVVGGATLTVAALAVVDAPCFFRSSFQHLEQQSPVALLPCKNQKIERGERGLREQANGKERRKEWRRARLLTLTAPSQAKPGQRGHSRARGATSMVVPRHIGSVASSRSNPSTAAATHSIEADPPPLRQTSTRAHQKSKHNS
jgi:hypothetical protein